MDTYREELPVYEHHLRASAALLDAFPKGALCCTAHDSGVHEIDVRYGNRDRKDIAFRTDNRRELLAFLAGMIAMSHDALEVPAKQDEQRCRVCGCTDDDCSGCIERTGEPCSWIEADLCSACVTVSAVDEIGDPEGPITEHERRDAEASSSGGYQD